MDDLGENIWDISSWTSEIHFKDAHLHQYFDSLPFEVCVKEIIDLAETYFQSVFRAYEGDDDEEEEEGVEIDFPYLDIIVLLVEEYIYGHYFHSVTPMQELRLLETLCVYFQRSKLDAVRYFIFDCLFGLPMEISDLQKGLVSFKMNVICKLTSMAVGTSCGNVLNCIAVWLHTYGTYQLRSTKLSSHVINDYFYICHQATHVIRNLITVSPVFTHQFIVAVSSLYKDVESDSESLKPLPPLPLVDIIGDWITEQPNICAVDVPALFLRLPSIHKFMRVTEHKHFELCPIFHISEWCLLEPLVRTGETAPVYAKLHYALINYLFSQKDIENSPLDDSDDLEPGELLEEENDGVELISKKDVSYLVGALKQHLDQHKDAAPNLVEESVNRLIQVLQVGKWSGSISLPDKDMASLLAGVPKTRLMKEILKI